MNINHKEKQLVFSLSLLSMFMVSYAYSMHPEQSMTAEHLSHKIVPDNSFAQLMKAVGGNELDTVRKLLTDQTYTPIHTSWGNDPLVWAAFHGNSEMTQLLLEKGFGLQGSVDGHTALHAAAYNKKKKVLKLLLTYPHCLVPQEIENARQTARTKLKRSFESLGLNAMITTVVPTRVVMQQLDPDGVYVQKLVERHFAHLDPFLTTQAEIISVKMTPYEAACDDSSVLSVISEDTTPEEAYEQARACKDLLEPLGFKERLSDDVHKNYMDKINEIMRK